jgi:hypothetical protein
MVAKDGPLSVHEAKEYLNLLETLPAQHRGPHRIFRNPVLDPKPLRELGRRLVASIEKRDERTYAAPSAWHAAAWLLDIAALAGQVATVDGDSGLRAPYDVRYGAPVFRGQNNPGQKLRPTLFREGGTQSDRRAMDLLAAVLETLFDYEENRMNGRLVHLAALQHFGMATPLLDFTADPRIAVYFACLGSDQNKNRQAAVFSTPLGVLTGLGGAVVLPPPWVKRLYAQRGLFFDFSSFPLDLDIEPVCFRVLFPPDPEFASTFPGEAALLLREPWYEAAIEWARKAARSTAAPLPADAAAKQLREDCGRPPFLLDAMVPAAMVPLLNQFADMCEWLALKVANGQLVYDLGAIESIGVHNMPLFRTSRLAWRSMAQLFPGHDLTVEPFLAAIQAVSAYLDEVESRANATR